MPTNSRKTPPLRNTRPTEREHIYKLWDALSDFDASRIDSALDHLLDTLCRWMDSENAFWIGGVRFQRGAEARRDAMSGWRPGALHMLDPAYSSPHRRRLAMRDMNTNNPGETSSTLASQAGKFRAYTLRSGKLVDLDEFRKSAHYDYYYRQSGISDRMWVVFPVNVDTEAYYCFDKYGQRRSFDPRDLDLAAQVLRGIKWFHRQLMLSHGLSVSDKPLTPTERRVLQALLTGKTEKQIAANLGITPGTTHQYATAIYRKFGTRGRSELMALWLSRGI